MQNSPVLISPFLLDFDARNPRILEFGLGSKLNEKELIKILWSTMGIEEIVLSIRASGFFQNEPLIAIKEGDKNIVIEGNRRLAALKCILDPRVQSFLNVGSNKFQIDPETRKTIEEIPVIFVNQRKDAWKFIGFKHINGPAKWGSYAKAQYIFEIKKEYGLTLEEIASQLGDTHKTVNKLYLALVILNQATEFRVFDITDIFGTRLYFSHLYTALTYEGYKEYLGINYLTEDEENPVPESKYEQLKDVLTWLFGSKKQNLRPIIRSQNPDLKNLEKVLRNETSISALKNNHSLDVAFDISIPKNENFINAIDEAKIYLNKALSLSVEGYDGKDINILKKIGTVHKIAKKIYEFAEEQYYSTLNKSNEKNIISEDGI